MKGLVTLSVFAIFYLVIIILFNEVASDPRGLQDKNLGQSLKEGNEAKDAKVEKVVTEPSQKAETNDKKKYAPPENPSKQAQRAAVRNQNRANDTNPLADLFQISDPTMRSTLGAVYGAYKGNDQCSRKAFCMLGNYMKDMPGQNLVFMLMGNYIPPEYSLYYEIFKVAASYGQTCDVYVCIPDTPPPDAASAAAPVTKFTANPQKQQQQQPSRPQEKPNKAPQKPQSFEDIFGNDIPR